MYSCFQVLGINFKFYTNTLKYCKVLKVIPLCSKYKYLVKAWYKQNIVYDILCILYPFFIMFIKICDLKNNV